MAAHHPQARGPRASVTHAALARELARVDLTLPGDKPGRRALATQLLAATPRSVSLDLPEGRLRLTRTLGSPRVNYIGTVRRPLCYVQVNKDGASAVRFRGPRTPLSAMFTTAVTDAFTADPGLVLLAALLAAVYTVETGSDQAAHKALCALAGTALADTAHRDTALALLDQGWAGTPSDLVAAAAAVHT